MAYPSPDMPDSSAPLFIVGTGRSGTTMLVRMIGKHPEVTPIKWESQFIVAMNGLLDLVDIGSAERAEVRTRQMLRRFTARMESHWFERVVRPAPPLNTRLACPPTSIEKLFLPDWHISRSRLRGTAS